MSKEQKRQLLEITRSISDLYFKSEDTELSRRLENAFDELTRDISFVDLFPPYDKLMGDGESVTSYQ